MCCVIAVNNVVCCSRVRLTGQRQTRTQKWTRQTGTTPYADLKNESLLCSVLHGYTSKMVYFGLIIPVLCRRPNLDYVAMLLQLVLQCRWCIVVSDIVELLQYFVISGSTLLVLLFTGLAAIAVVVAALSMVVIVCCCDCSCFTSLFPELPVAVVALLVLSCTLGITIGNHVLLPLLMIFCCLALGYWLLCVGLTG